MQCPNCKSRSVREDDPVHGADGVAGAEQRPALGVLLVQERTAADCGCQHPHLVPDGHDEHRRRGPVWQQQNDAVHAAPGHRVGSK